MKEVTGDIWDLARNCIICVSTNGDVNKRGEAVMGRGLALEAKQRYPHFPAMLGYRLKTYGNTIHVFSGENEVIGPEYYWVVTIPVKHHWYETANLNLIRTSLTDLIEELRLVPPGMPVYLTRLGCANGARDWKTEVKPIMQEILKSDRFIVVEKP